VVPRDAASHGRTDGQERLNPDTSHVILSIIWLATGWTAGVKFPAGTTDFSLLERSDRLWGPGVKQTGREADHSPTSAEVKNAWIYTCTPLHVFVA
jgi:hypothetical protein